MGIVQENLIPNGIVPILGQFLGQFFGQFFGQFVRHLSANVLIIHFILKVLAIKKDWMPT